MALEEMLERVGAILSANVNDLLGGAEDPVKMSAEFLRRAQAELSEVRHEVAMVIAGHEDTRRAYAENEEDIANWARKAEIALTAGRDDLARKAIAAKQREERENADLKIVLDEQQKQVEALKDAAQKLAQKILDVENQRDILVAQHRTAIARRHVQQVAGGIGDSQALAGFDRLQTRAQNEMHVAALETLDADTLEEQFKDLEAGQGDANVEAELAAMREHLERERLKPSPPRAAPELPAA